MKKKILLLLLCMLMIVPLFVVGASAEHFTDGFADGMFHVGTYDPITEWNPAGDIVVKWFLTDYGMPSMDQFPYYTTYDEPSYVQFLRDKEDVPMILEVYGSYNDQRFEYYLESYNLIFYYGPSDSNDDCCSVKVYNYDQLQEGMTKIEPVFVYNVGQNMLLNPNEWGYDVTIPLVYATESFVKIEFNFNPLDIVRMGSYADDGLNSFLHCIDLHPQIIYYYNSFDHYSTGWADGHDEGYEIGFTNGCNEITRTFDGVSMMLGAIFEAPFRFLSSFMNVSLFGINVFGVVSLVISIALIWFVIKIIIKVVGHFKS